MTKDISARLDALEARNTRVELDKKWETSLTRMLVLAGVTYILAALFMIITELPRPFVGAMVPALGFVLSVQSLPFIKAVWSSMQK